MPACESEIEYYKTIKIQSIYRISVVWIWFDGSCAATCIYHDLSYLPALTLHYVSILIPETSYTLIKSLSTADQAKNKFIKNRLAFWLKDLTYMPFLLCGAAIFKTAISYLLVWESCFQTMGYFQTTSFDCSSFTIQSKRLVKIVYASMSVWFAASANNNT